MSDLDTGTGPTSRHSSVLDNTPSPPSLPRTNKSVYNKGADLRADSGGNVGLSHHTKCYD